MKHIITTIVVFSFATACSNANQSKEAMVEQSGTAQSDSMTFISILRFISNNTPDEDRQFHSKKIFSDFNFQTFEPIDGVIDSSSFTVFFNKKNEIVKLKTTSNREFLNYEFDVLYNKELNYKALFVYKYNEGEKQWIDGVILLYKGKCFFIGENVNHIDFLKSERQITSIMLLDKNLKAERILKFSEGNFLFMTEVIYKQNRDLFSERFFEPRNKWQLNDTTLFDSVVNVFRLDTTKFSFYKERRIGIVEKYSYLPLWRFGGNHDYIPN